MLNILYESICVTSATQRENQLLLCSPPYIKFIRDKPPFDLIESRNMNAQFIYQMDSELAILTLNNEIHFTDKDYNRILFRYTLPQLPLQIYNYQDYLLIEYDQEYQLVYPTEINPIQKKNSIISFAHNPNKSIVSVSKNQILENNQINYLNQSIPIEMGVQQVYLASKTQSVYIYQSVILPQLTIIDLDLKQEIQHIDFSDQLDNVYILDEKVLLQSETRLFNLKQETFEEINMILSCCICFGNSKYIFYGSIYDNSKICNNNNNYNDKNKNNHNSNNNSYNNNTILSQYHNLGQVVDLHPYSQSCYIASLHKEYPVNLFRKGINEQVIGKFKLSNSEYPRSIHFINNNLFLLSYATHSEIYTLPQFQLVHIGLITNLRTILVLEMDDKKILQVTQQNILLISNYTVLKSTNFSHQIQIAKYNMKTNQLYTYSRGQINFYLMEQNELKLISQLTVHSISTMQIINDQLIYTKWFNDSVFTTNEMYQIKEIGKSSIISISNSRQYIFLGLNDGNLIIIDILNYKYIQKIEISNTHPVNLININNNKQLILSHHIYMIDDTLNITIVNWEHLYDVSVYNQQLIGIVQSEIQLVSLSNESSVQCQEMKYIKNKNVIGIRFVKEYLIILLEDGNLESYYDDILKYTINSNLKPIKLELFDNLIVIGYMDQDNGKIQQYNEKLTLLSTFTLNEMIYDIKVNEKNQIYYSTDTAIYNLSNTFYYDFKLQILGFEIKDNYFLIFDQYKGVHLFYYDDKMISLGTLILQQCHHAAFYYEDIIAFSDNELKVGKSNSMTLGISEAMEIVLNKSAAIMYVKDQTFSTKWGALGNYE